MSSFHILKWCPTTNLPQSCFCFRNKYLLSSLISSLLFPIALNAANVSSRGQLTTSCHVAFKGAGRGGEIVNNNLRPGEPKAANSVVKSSVAGLYSHSHFAQHGLVQVPVVSCRTYARHWLYQHAIGKVSDVFIGLMFFP